MKIGNLQILTAYIGNKQLTGQNAYVGTYKVIDGEGPVKYEGLTFTAEEANSTLTYHQSAAATAEYSFDTVNWNDANGVELTLANVGDKVYFRGNITGNQSTASYLHFDINNGKIAASGNISSLCNGSNSIEYTYFYYRLFNNCTALTTAPELPATKLRSYCYAYMFNGCSSLTTAPELPATTLPLYCYNSMFSGCSSLVNAPALPATSLSISCYQSMFSSCRSLTTAPALPATSLSNNCYNLMFYYCRSLTTAPVLPATSLGYGCYYKMFEHCFKLNKIICYATTWNSSYTDAWLNDVSLTGDFYNLGGAAIPTSISGIPSTWNVHTELD